MGVGKFSIKSTAQKGIFMERGIVHLKYFSIRHEILGESFDIFISSHRNGDTLGLLVE